MFSARIREERKDTPQNVLTTEEFVANVVTESVAKAMNESATIVDRDANEFERFGIERTPSQTVSPPRVADSPVHFECTLRESLRVHDYDVLFGEVQHLHLADRVLTDGTADADKLDAVGRIGNSGYTTIQRMDIESSHK
jgi:flavin reductase (DIM6/NTAB) family NADH-FMN oxidoreductase RutF